jgi:hypothetical protein
MAARKKSIKRDTLHDKRMVAAAITLAAPPARGQESLAEYMGEDKYLNKPPKRVRRGRGRYDD